MLVAAVLTAFTAGPALGRTTVAPQRSTMSSLVAAGGGPEDFKTTTLVGALAGTDSNAELAALTQAFGAPAVKGFIVIFDFVIADALRLFGENRAAPPASPDPDPGDGEGAVPALYRAGFDPATRTFDVEVMFNRLVSPPLRVGIMSDVGAKLGAAAAARYRTRSTGQQNKSEPRNCTAHSLTPLVAPQSSNRDYDESSFGGSCGLK